MQQVKASVIIGVATAAIAEAGPPWSSRDDIPSGCIPMMKVPDGGRCLFDDQCQSTFCCPYYRSCIGNPPGYLEYSAVEVDPVRLAMMWGDGGAVGTYDGVQNHVLEGATDTCDRDRPADDFTLCTGYTMNEEYAVALEDSGLFIKAYNLDDPGCACDERMKALTRDGDWTGAFIDGVFRNYCKLGEWDYILSEKEADRCPPGRAIVTEVTECQAAIAYLGLGDSTAYMNGQFGAAAFPGCVNNVNNNQVAFNGDNDAQEFQLSSIEQFVCKRDGPTTTPESTTSWSLPSVTFDIETTTTSLLHTTWDWGTTSEWSTTPEWPARPTLPPYNPDVKCTRVENSQIDELVARGYLPKVCGGDTIPVNPIPRVNIEF